MRTSHQGRIRPSLVNSNMAYKATGSPPHQSLFEEEAVKGSKDTTNPERDTSEAESHSSIQSLSHIDSTL